MDFGIALATTADAWKVTKRAEELGFSHAWFYDTQMLSADCFVAMGAAAVNTSKIRLGTGVLIPSNRIPAVTAWRRSARSISSGPASDRNPARLSPPFEGRDRISQRRTRP